MIQLSNSLALCHVPCALLYNLSYLSHFIRAVSNVAGVSDMLHQLQCNIQQPAYT